MLSKWKEEDPLQDDPNNGPHKDWRSGGRCAGLHSGYVAVSTEDVLPNHLICKQAIADVVRE